MKVHSANLETLPALDPRGADHARPGAAFPLEGASAEVVVRAARDGPPGAEAALADLDARRGRRPGTSSPVATGRVRTSPRTVAPRCSTLAIPFEESDPRVDDAVERLRDRPGAGRRSGGLDAERAVGGGAAESYDSAQHLST